MGFELNRLMQQYGVATPGRINYSGATPVDPGARPVATDTLTGEALTKAQGDYDNLLAKYNFDKTASPADTAAYDAYKKEYQTRLQNTPMYMQSQFQTGYEPKSAGLQWATRPDVNVQTGSGMGIKQFNKNIQDWAAQNPTAYSDAINAFADKYGIGAQDIYNATQNRWGNVLQAPKYGTYKPPEAPKAVSPVVPPVAPPIEDPVVVTPPPIVLPPILPPVIDDPVIDPVVVDPVIDPVVDPVVETPSIYTDPIITTIPDEVVDPADIPLITAPDILETIPTIYTKPIVSDIKDDEVKPADIPLITAPDILETVPTIYTDPIITTIPDEVVDPAQIPLIIPETPLGLPDFTVETPKEDKSFYGDPDFVEVGPSRGLIKNQEELPEEFDKYLVTDTPTVTTDTGSDFVAADPSDFGYDPFDSNYDFSGSDFNFGGGGGGFGGKYFDDQSIATMAFAKGGKVKTHYQTAGSVSLPEGYINPEDEVAQATPVNMIDPPPPIITEPKAPLAAIATQNAPAAPAAVAPKPPAPFGDERMGNIQALLAAYGPKDGAYGAELKTARASAKAESDAFAKMLSDSMKSPENEQSSKAEMYFRLAAAFGAPTKTGHFAENLGMVGKELGDYSKEQRASRQQKLALALKGQEMKMGAAKDDLRTLQALSAEEMKDKRAIATELIKDYIKSGEPQSAAGKQALDEGLKAGTPAYQKRVQEIGNMNVEGKLAQITASLANMNTAAANLALAQEKFQNQKTQQAKLTGPELKLKTETEETLAQTDQALVNLKKAYALNPNTFDTSLVDATQRKLLEVGGSKDPKVAATREMENLLEKAALSQLKATFPGAISNDERKALQDVQGLGAKSKEERARIMKNGYAALKTVSERHRKRLNEINSGLYRDTAAPSIDEGTE